MKLLLDIGNTRIKSALWNGQELIQHHAVVHGGLSPNQLQAQLLQRYGAVDAVWIANVAGADIAQRISQAAQRLWQIDPAFATSVAVHGEVRNAYPQPEKLGVDRWLSLLATHAMHTSAQLNLIVNAGTAMTLDTLSADGQHHGGLIIPGPDMMIGSLLNNTSNIANFAATITASGEQGDDFFANNTLDAIHQGALHACAALVEAAYRKLALSESLKVLITGGAAQHIIPVLGIPVHEVNDLVLQGLAVLAQN